MKQQIEIPGTEREVDEVIEEKFWAFRAAEQERLEAVERARDLKEGLQELLAERGLECYWVVDGDRRWLVSREHVDRAKVVEIVKRKRRGSDDDGAEALL